MNYVFQGEVIRICDKKWPRLVQQFKNIDLMAELEIIDLALSENPPKNWWMPMVYKLKYQNEKPKKNVSVASNRSTREIPLDDELNDISWGDGL